jgi:Protein of unknown function with HXXEE motif
LLIRYWLWLAFGLAPLLAAVPFFVSDWPPSVLFTYLLSPAYMLHQIEEHWRDRFRTFVNQRVFGGSEALTAAAVFWINVPIVWGLNLGAFLSAWLARFDFALVAAYLMLVNAVVHTLGIFRFGYNPGLITSLVVFFPLSLAAILAAPASLPSHLFALGAAVLGHALLFGYALLRVRRLKQAQKQSS